MSMKPSGAEEPAGDGPTMETTLLLANSADADAVSAPDGGVCRDEEWRDAQTKRLLRKVDLHLIPFLVVMYLLNFLDRANLTQARQGSLEQDLGMKGTDFNFATSIFFVGYLLMQLPSNLLIARVRPSLYLSAAMTLWGVVSTCNAAVHSFRSLVVVRFVLGFVEAPFFPGAIFLMSSWYTRAELTTRIAWFYSGNALANMFGGLLGASILGGMDGVRGIAGWRWLFILEGASTIAVAIAASFVLPDYPHSTRWLTTEERDFALQRLLEDINEDARTSSSKSVSEGIKLVLQDYRLYLFVLLQHISLLSQTFQYFLPAILDVLGYGRTTTLLLTAPVWFATFLASICATWTSAKTNDRSLHIIGLMLVAALGNAIVTSTTHSGARFFAVFLMPMGAVSAYQIIVSWVANSFPQPLVKRSAAIAICNMIGNTATIYGTYMYPSSDAPLYTRGGTINAVICLIVVVLALLLRVVHIRENRKLLRSEVEEAFFTGSSENVHGRTGGFRYWHKTPQMELHHNSAYSDPQRAISSMNHVVD